MENRSERGVPAPRLQIAHTRLEFRVSKGLSISQTHLGRAVLHNLFGADRLPHLRIGDLRSVSADAFNRQYGQSHNERRHNGAGGGRDDRFSCMVCLIDRLAAGVRVHSCSSFAAVRRRGMATRQYNTTMMPRHQSHAERHGLCWTRCCALASMCWLGVALSVRRK